MAHVICIRVQRNPRYVQDGEQKVLTVLEGVSTAQVLQLPQIIDKSAAHSIGWHVYVTEDEPTYCAYSPKGWMDNQLGVEYMVQIFEPLTAAV